MATFFRDFISSLQEPNQCVDPDAGQPNQSVDPNAGQPNPPADPNAGQPNQSADPNAGQPNQSVDPNAGQPNQCVDPNAGQPGQSAAPGTDPGAPNASSGDLSQDYNTALQAGDWPTAAEKLNGFNRDDIVSRLKGLTATQIGNINQGALDNPRVGPGSQVAQLTRTVTVNILIGAGGLVTVTPTPGLPDGFDPNVIDPKVFELPKISEPFPGGPTGAGGTAAADTAGTAAATADATGTAAATGTGVGVGVTVTVVAAAFVVGLVSPFLIGYSVDRSAELRDRPDPDEISKPGGAPDPVQEPDAGVPAPAVDPNSAQPVTAPGAQNPVPATDPTTGQPVQAPSGLDHEPMEAARKDRDRDTDDEDNARRRDEERRKERERKQAQNVSTDPRDMDILENGYVEFSNGERPARAYRSVDEALQAIRESGYPNAQLGDAEPSTGNNFHIAGPHQGVRQDGTYIGTIFQGQVMDGNDVVTVWTWALK
jgi:hypothetical protein